MNEHVISEEFRNERKRKKQEAKERSAQEAAQPSAQHSNITEGKPPVGPSPSSNAAGVSSSPAPAATAPAAVQAPAPAAPVVGSNAKQVAGALSPEPVFLFDLDQCTKIDKMSREALDAVCAAINIGPFEKKLIHNPEVKFKLFRFCATSDTPTFDVDNLDFSFPNLLVQDFVRPTTNTPA